MNLAEEFEMNYNNADNSLEELNTCAKIITESSKVFDANLDLINSVNFFEVASTTDTYQKFKNLNKIPEEYCKEIEEYVNLLKELS